MQFDFGQNWDLFSQKALDRQKFNQARQDFMYLTENIHLKNKSFLDIGFGQGLSLIFAKEMGAMVVGNEINNKCKNVLVKNIPRFSHIDVSEIPIIIGSILDRLTLNKLMNQSPAGRGYDIVHSWGVLHHTGNLKKALKNASSLVKPGGYLIIAIYSRHWSNPAWKSIKWTYCKSTQLLKKMIILFLYPIIWMAKLIVTGENPKRQTRGMDFYYNVIDWVGGYPYEYASISEIKKMINANFICLEITPAKVPTGCNEYIFKRVEN
jgi:2-polyprenyl-6-hydroxyphenyl methylase/3-demethylubiquinone-9 3-methyltransferase